MNLLCRHISADCYQSELIQKSCWKCAYCVSHKCREDKKGSFLCLSAWWYGSSERAKKRSAHRSLSIYRVEANVCDMGLHTWHFNILCNRGCYLCIYNCLHHEGLHTCESAAYTRHLHGLWSAFCWQQWSGLQFVVMCCSGAIYVGSLQTF